MTWGQGLGGLSTNLHEFARISWEWKAEKNSASGSHFVKGRGDKAPVGLEGGETPVLLDEMYCDIFHRGKTRRGDV